MRRCFLTLCCCFALLTFIAPLALAQETTATLAGMVTDQSGAVLPGVVVSLKHLPTGRVTEIVTGTEGVYLQPLLPIGAYEVTFSLQGFQPRVVKGVVLAVTIESGLTPFSRPAVSPRSSRLPARPRCRRRRRCRH